MKSLADLLSKRLLYNYILKAPVPRWIIYTIDLLIVVSSYFIILGADILRHVPYKSFDWQFLLITTAVYAIVNYLTKGYQYIIRLTVLEDLLKAFITVTISTVILFIINFAISQFLQFHRFSYWEIIFIATFSFSIISVSRLTLKSLYIYITTPFENRKKVLILGTSLNSIMLANALKNENGGKYEPIALLNITKRKTNSSVNGLPIEDLSTDNIETIFKKYGTDKLILHDEYKDLDKQYLDALIENGISILIVNHVEEFNSEKDDSISISPHIKNIQIEELLGRDVIKNENTLIKSNVANSTVLITGAAGSIGSEIVRQVARYKAKLIILIDQAETPMHNMQLELTESFPDIKVKLIIGDVKDIKRMEMVFMKFKPDFVFHAAAYKHVPMMELNPTEAILTNVMGTKNIADLSTKYKVKKFVMISTDKAVNPTNIMGATKRIAEVYVQSLFFKIQKGDPNSTKFITTRFGNVLGSNGSVIPLFRSQIEKGGPITITHHDIIRYFMTIPEACSLVLEAGSMGNGGEIYIFDMGKPVKIYDLACKMISLAGLELGKDIEIIETGLRPGEKLYEELLNDKEKTEATVNHKIMIAKTQKYDYANVCNSIESIIDKAKNGNIHQLVTEMKLFIPEYKSMNSEFEKIDAEINNNN